MTDQANGMVNDREIVLDMLLEVVEEDKFSHTVLNGTLKRYQSLDKQERAFITRLFTGTVKSFLTLDYIIDQFASLPVRKMKPLIRNLLRMSVYQLIYMEQAPESAVCNEAVKLAKKRGFTGLSGFVNGILRNIARNETQIKYPDRSRDNAEYLGIMYSVPRFLVDKLIAQYGSEVTEAMLKAFLKEKEVTIRCNTKKLLPDALKKLLEEEQVTVRPSEYLDYAFKLENYDALERLKAFTLGYFTIQDVSSMLVCQTAGITEKDFVVDVCAAPGGKALHAAEKADRVSARDLTEYKINLIEENIRRMGFTNVGTRVWDASRPDESIKGMADVVIADLPCSGLGIIGKKPDIKYKASEEQMKELIKLQREILKVVKDYVKPGGVLLYSTCTINKDENTGNRSWFLQEFDFEPVSLDPYLPGSLKSETTKEGYLQLLPGIHNTDGFFLAKLRKRM